MLLIDAGNTRLKWAVLSEARLGAQQAEAYAEWGVEQFRQRVLIPAGGIDRLLVGNVGGRRIASLIADAIAVVPEITAEFVEATRSGGGIQNGYSDPSQLGVDRWAAMIGARAHGAGPVCVVSVGTAMTIDGVDASGLHLGGLIVPGPDLMVSSLMHNTSDIASRSQDGTLGKGLFADNTLGGVHQGTLHALACLIQQAMNFMTTHCGQRPALLITGGAAHRLEPFMTGPLQVLPDLVLKGLAVLAQASPQQAPSGSSASKQ